MLFIPSLNMTFNEENVCDYKALDLNFIEPISNVLMGLKYY